MANLPRLAAATSVDHQASDSLPFAMRVRIVVPSVVPDRRFAPPRPMPQIFRNWSRILTSSVDPQPSGCLFRHAFEPLLWRVEGHIETRLVVAFNQ